MTTARTMSFASESAQEKLCTILAALASRQMEALELATALSVSRRLVYLYLHHLEDTRRIRVADTIMRQGRETAIYALESGMEDGTQTPAPPQDQPCQMPTPGAVAAVRRRLLAQQSPKPRPARRDPMVAMFFGVAGR